MRDQRVGEGQESQGGSSKKLGGGCMCWVP